MDHDKPTLFERFFAALFSAIAAGVTYALWVFFHSGRWGAEQIQALQSMGKWVVLAGGNQPLLSLRTFFTLLVLASIAYGVYRLAPF